MGVKRSKSRGELRFGDNLKRERLKRKLTYAQLGELTGIDPTNLKRFETKERMPRLIVAYCIADGLGVKINVLIN